MILILHGYVIHDIWYIICDTRDAWYMWYTILDICDMWYMIHVIFDNHITAPGGRYAGGNPVQRIFLHPQPGPLRHSCGEILVLVIIFDYIYCIWTKYTFTSSTLATLTPLRWDLKYYSLKLILRILINWGLIFKIYWKQSSPKKYSYILNLGHSDTLAVRFWF